MIQFILVVSASEAVVYCQLGLGLLSAKDARAGGRRR